MHKPNKQFDRFLLFRIVLGTFMLFKFVSLWPHWLDFYGETGFFPRDVVEITNYPLIAYFDVADAVAAVFGTTTDGASLLLLYAGMGLSVCLIVGFGTRLATLGLLLLNTSLTNSFMEFSYGVDFFLSTLLLYALFFPVGRQYSVDGWITDKFSLPSISDQTRISPKQACTILAIHLCIIYLVGGASKAFGPTWWNGEAIWTAMQRPGLQWSIVIADYVRLETIYTILGIGTLLVELGYALMIWFRPTRPLWLLGTLGMHLFIGMVLELHLFASVMIFFNLIAFGGDTPLGFLKVPRLFPVRRVSQPA